MEHPIEQPYWIVPGRFLAGEYPRTVGADDADTNAAICGALLGAVHGRRAVPAQWQDAVLNCRPEAGRSGVNQPRPQCYWPVDALDLAGQLLDHATQP